jgi:hypothetical protein
MNFVDIQVQYDTGVWATMQTVNNQDQVIAVAMKSLKKAYPKYRVRAVDKESGRVIDIL